MCCIVFARRCRQLAVGWQAIRIHRTIRLDENALASSLLDSVYPVVTYILRRLSSSERDEANRRAESLGAVALG